jgi:branched-chain amino acid aminotransferase
MAVCKGRFYFDGRLFRSTALFGEEVFASGVSFYEVLRVMRGICLFMEDHLLRLRQSASLSGPPFPFDPHFAGHTIRQLIAKNRLKQGNIKLVLHFSDAGKASLYAFVISHSYPGPRAYKEGIVTDLYAAVRRDPNVKRIVPDLQLRLKAFISRKRIYEALLVDENGFITEGSRSNVFFIQGDIIYTAPGEMVLKGITREKVIEICKTLNHKVIEKPVSINNLSQMNSAFLTGTSPMVLPVRQIGRVSFPPSGRVIDRLRNTYNALIEDYLSSGH